MRVQMIWDRRVNANGFGGQVIGKLRVWRGERVGGTLQRVTFGDAAELARCLGLREVRREHVERGSLTQRWLAGLGADCRGRGERDIEEIEWVG